MFPIAYPSSLRSSELALNCSGSLYIATPQNSPFAEYFQSQNRFDFMVTVETARLHTMRFHSPLSCEHLQCKFTFY